MGKSHKNSNKNFNKKSNKNSINEHQRTIVASEDTSKCSTKIIDVNDDCLEKLFELLDLQSLFNMALANEWLRPAANEVYKRKFGQKEVRLCVDSSQIVERLFEKETKIFVNGRKMCLQYLRCFGPSIGHFEIFHMFLCDQHHCQHIHQYIEKYCDTDRLATKKNFKMINYPTKLQKFSYTLRKYSKCYM